MLNRVSNYLFPRLLRSHDPALHARNRRHEPRRFVDHELEQDATKKISIRLIPCDSGKGTPRRKVKKVHKSAGTDDKKLQGALKKLNVQPIQAIEEVNMFKTDGNVIHFSAPKGMLTPPFRKLGT